MRNSFIKKYQNNSLVFFIALFLVLMIGISYAFFSYNQVGNNNQLIAGDIYMHYNETSKGISLQGVLPESDSVARSRNDNYMTFTIDGVNTTKDKDIYYEILLSHGNDVDGKNRLNDEHLKFDLEETTIVDGTETTNTVLTGVSFNEINNTRIWVNTIDKNTDSEITITYKLRMWISDEVWISDTDVGADYTMSEYQNSFASIRVNVYGDFVEKKIRFLYNELETNLASFLLADDGDARIVAGSNDDVNNNYIWYSGKLWRVVSLNNDGTVKLVTEDSITSIYWGEKATYEGSWVYQWLNEDFLDTLYNNEDFVVEDYLWNATTMTVNSKPPVTTMVKGSVGLINYYEYYKSFTGASVSTVYLRNGYCWWLLTPYNDSNVWRVDEGGGMYNSSPSYYHQNTIRPSIVLKNNILIRDGEGTKNNPYILIGDISNDAVNTFINSRVSGEYLKFNNQLYRIVGIENNTTKITQINYVKDNTNKVLTKSLSSPYSFGNSSNTKSDNYWDYYLNNTWYNSINSKYRNMLTTGTWYLGTQDKETSYKNSICLEKDTTETTKQCVKTDVTYKGYVGSGRIGEMFTTQMIDSTDGFRQSWTITPEGTSTTWGIDSYGTSYSFSRSVPFAIRPSMFLKSNVKIVSGLGTKDSPFEIELAS